MPSARTAKPCIFCGGTSRKTREHIWGDWLKAYVSHDLNKHGMVYHDIDRPGEVNLRRRIRAGDPLNSQVRVVCANCNNGWMSIIQNEAKPYLIPLIQGARTLLSRDGQIKVATWITMATMTAEFLTYAPRQIAITAEERNAFLNNPRPIGGWRIWIAFWDEPHRIPDQWTHTSSAIYDPEDIPDVEHFDGAPQTNTQTTTARIGKLFFHVMSSTDPRNVALWDWRDDPRARSLLVPLWPIRGQFIVWPVHSLTDADARRIGRAFVLRVDEIAQRLGY